MMDSRARADFELLAALESERAGLDGLYREIARRVWPDYAQFQRSSNTPEGRAPAFDLFDSTGAVALDRYAAAMQKYTAPNHRRWHSLTVRDERLKQRGAVKRWLEHATSVLFRRRYAPWSNFGAQYYQSMKSLGAFGPALSFAEEVPGVGNRYRALNLTTTYITEDPWHRINGAAIKHEWTAAQAAEKFGRDALPPRLRQALDSASASDKQRKWDFLHVIQPRAVYTDARGPMGFQIVSRYSCREDHVVVAEGGYRVLPIFGARMSTMPGEKYGRSSAMLVLPSLKMLNAIKRDFLVATHKALDPPLLAYEDGVLSKVKTAAGAVTTGGLDSNGRPLVAPLYTGARPEWAQQAIDDERRPINDVFLITLFQILADDPRTQTATEVVQREAEKQTLLAPATERLQSEYFGAQIEREIDLAVEAGDLDEVPPELAEALEELDIQYEGDFALAQKASEVAGIMRAAEAAPAFAALDPTAPQRVKWDKAYARAVEGLGVPLDMIRSDAEMEQIQAQAAQDEAATMALQGAPAAASAAKDFASAEQIRRSQLAAQGAPLNPA